MTLLEFKEKYGYTFSELSHQTRDRGYKGKGVSLRTVKYWCELGHTVITKGHSLVIIDPPKAKPSWVSKEYMDQKSVINTPPNPRKKLRRKK